MNDIKVVNFNDLKTKKALYQEALESKGIELDLDYLLALHNRCRELTGALEEVRRQRNVNSREVALDRENQDLIDEGRRINRVVNEHQEKLRTMQEELNLLALRLPGLPLPEVPRGKTEAENKELFRIGDLPGAGQCPLDHMELARMHGMVDIEGAVKAAGTRAYALLGTGAVLENALLRFAYDRILEKGYLAVQAPVMVREPAMQGTGYFPFGEDNAYHLEKDGLYLTGTAEVGILAIHADRCLEDLDKPLRLFGMSTCFRREAGAAGRDTRGLYRVHQFHKVEQVIICPADFDLANIEHLKLRENAEQILQDLELPYRVVDCCTGELGLGQARKYDIETWMPSREAYGETHSCSNFLDFQARRLNLRYREKGAGRPYAFTLNNTALATPRILIAFLENHQRAGGAIHIPPALRPYLGGIERLEPAN